MDGTGILNLLLVTSFLFMHCQIVYSETQNPRINYMHIQSVVKFRFATTLVTSKVANSAKTPVEAHFEVTLPDAAFITEFVMEIDGLMYPGKIIEKAKAKEKYDTAKNRGQSAGHVAQKPRHTNRFNVDVNLAAESKVTFNLTYQELLERVYGEYKHIIYVDPGQIVEDFKIDVYIHESRNITQVSVPRLRNDIISGTNEEKNALAVIDRPTRKSATVHYAPTADDQKQMSDQGISGLFVVEYDVQRKFDAGEVMVVDGYFVHFFAPEGMKPLPKDVLFILDVSGSMSGTKIRQQKSAMIRILKDLPEGDRFNIMLFNDNNRLWQPTVLLANNKNKQEALQYVNKEMIASGGTNINDAILSGIMFLNSIPSKETTGNQRKILVFLTDGLGSIGVDTVLDNIDKKNIRGLPIFSLAFGNNADYEFVKKVAVKNKGVARKIFEDSDASLQIKGFYDEISSSVLQNVTFKYAAQNATKMNFEDSGASLQKKGFYDEISSSALQNVTFEYLDKNTDVTEYATRTNFDAFFNGKELVIAGKLSDDTIQVLKLLVTGNGVHGNVELELESDIQSRDPELLKAGNFEKITERIWAYLTIKQLLEEAIGETNEFEKKKLNNKALAMSLKYKFVTPLTSMIVLMPDDRDFANLEENEDARLALSKISGKKQTSSTLGNTKQTSSSPGSSPKRGGGGGVGGSNSYSRGGGGGGDPHFMLRIYGIEFPLCFDVDARDGDVIRMLKDPIADITIYAGIVRSTMKKKDGEFKTFIGEIVILAPAARIDIKPDEIKFNGHVLSWDDASVFEMEGIKIHANDNVLNDRTVHIDFGNDISIEIRRLMKEGSERVVSYLNMYIDNEKGISDKAGGILGRFVHQNTTLFKIGLDKKGRQHGHFRETENTSKTHFNAILHKKPDIITGKMVWCWNVHMKTKGLLGGDIKDYVISDIAST
ncbi:inter-alpha-trypsin inhibitor heavy chain H3-like isoform X8 [Mytilus californianus]|uniref:inter-alpha-trypsin inhibitor heavy chain H3-like isoform X8 n=1 Tax=Mytilus californianus TaxID=6549 RepID=UPI0022459613|nr:inter-alpha-trypsin inhibitor heavy chain H3-like isoform X8 [Mytilus californianus]